MTISVLMSVYKADIGLYLNRALQSIWDDQSYKPLEIILIEDGPLTEELEAVVDQWQKRLGSSLVVCRNETNIGLTKSLNKGLQFVKGDLIARMDSDDIAMPTRFELQERFLTQHLDVAVVGGALQEFNDANPCLSIRNYPQNHQEVLNYIYKASPLAHPAVMMRRSIFDAGIRYNEQYRMSQDIALWFDIIEAGYKIANIEEIVLRFRRDGDIFRRRGKEKAYHEFEIYMRGIRRLYGLVTWRYIYPIARVCFRLLPISWVKALYDSWLRNVLLGKN